MSLLDFDEDDWRAVPARAIALYEKLAELPAPPQLWDPEQPQGQHNPPYSPGLRHAAEAFQLLPSTTGIPNAPHPLTSMLAGGLMGAGVGYGAGWLGEHFLPESWQGEGHMRRSGAVLGALAGMSPGMLWAYSRMHKPGDTLGPASQHMKNYLDSLPAGSQTPPAIKQALLEGTGAFSDMPLINSNEFGQTIWTDPRVAPYIPLPTRAAISGVLAGAARLAGGGVESSMVSPWDVARLAVGMGSGYMSGAMVGKALGVMTGMPEHTQELLKNTGMYAGVVRVLVPKLFGE